MSSMHLAIRDLEEGSTVTRSVAVSGVVASNAALPHEIGFFVLYGLVIVRLLLSPFGPSWTELAIWSGFAAASAALLRLTGIAKGNWAWRTRLGAYVVLMNAVYFRMGDVFAATGALRRDDALQRVDTVLFGRPLPLYFDGASHQLVTELLSLCY